MSDVERLKDELALAELIEQDRPLREKAYADGATKKDIDAFKMHNEKCAEAANEFRLKYPPFYSEPDAEETTS